MTYLHILHPPLSDNWHKKGSILGYPTAATIRHGYEARGHEAEAKSKLLVNHEAEAEAKALTFWKHEAEAEALTFLKPKAEAEAQMLSSYS